MGDIGTFQMTASSGTSSSESWYSASSSLTVLRGCHDCLRPNALKLPPIGDRPVLECEDLGTLLDMSSFEGEGDLDSRVRPVRKAAEELEAVLKPGRMLLFCPLTDVSCSTPLTCPRRLGYLGLAMCTACIESSTGAPFFLESVDCVVRGEGRDSIGLRCVPKSYESRPSSAMSSKWDKFSGPAASERDEE